MTMSWGHLHAWESVPHVHESDGETTCSICGCDGWPYHCYCEVGETLYFGLLALIPTGGRIIRLRTAVEVVDAFW